MIKGEIVKKVQEQIDDTSNRAKAIIETSLIGTYTEIMQNTAMYLIEEEEVSDQTIIDQRHVDLAFEFSRIERVFYKSNTSSTYSELKRMNRKTFNPNIDAGNINKYYIRGDRVYFDRPSNSAGIILFMYVPEVAPLLLDTDVLRIPDKYESVVIYGTTMRTLIYEGDTGAGDFGTLFKMELDNMIKELATQEPTLKPPLYGSIS